MMIWICFAGAGYGQKKEENQCTAIVQSPGSNLSEMLWWELKKPVLKQMSTNLNGLKQWCKEEREYLLQNGVRHR